MHWLASVEVRGWAHAAGHRPLRTVAYSPMLIHESTRPVIALPHIALTDFVFEQADQWPDAPAFIEGPTGRVITFREIRDLSRRVSVALVARGLTKGDVVAIYCPNIPEYAAILHGAAPLGVICTTANPLYSPDELRRQLTDSAAQIIFTVPALLDKAVAAAVGTGAREVVVIGDAAAGATAFSKFTDVDGVPPKVVIDPDNDIVVLPYSSGTTGLPKGVMLTHANLVHNTLQSAFMERETPRGPTVGVLPMFHAYGMFAFLVLRVRTGQCTVTLPQFDLATFLRLTSEHKVPHLYLVPPILLALARHPVVAQYDLSSVKVITVGAAPVSGALANEVTARIGAIVRQGYGATEASPVISAGDSTPEGAHPDSAGRLVSNTDARFVDPVTGKDVAAGESGELWVRGPQVMRGYLNRPDATAECITPDGWLRTGDVGFIDADGYIYIRDRLKEFIKVNAYQVAPAELEALLLTHPAVADAAVIRKASETHGEVPKAFVVKRADANVTADEIMAFVADRVAPYKKVRHVEFVDAIPKSPAGKILRRELVVREKAAEASAQTSAT